MYYTEIENNKLKLYTYDNKLITSITATNTTDLYYKLAGIIRRLENISFEEFCNTQHIIDEYLIHRYNYTCKDIKIDPIPF